MEAAADEQVAGDGSRLLSIEVELRNNTYGYALGLNTQDGYFDTRGLWILFLDSRPARASVDAVGSAALTGRFWDTESPDTRLYDPQSLGFLKLSQEIQDLITYTLSTRPGPLLVPSFWIDAISFHLSIRSVRSRANTLYLQNSHFEIMLSDKDIPMQSKEVQKGSDEAKAASRITVDALKLERRAGTAFC
ncbi:Hypothetical predicted protein [Lecanosticta acicola]|uniref:Uncharacterized protein n=1 Tax=Lecanosticta acicola TaxID=111012 RepID=A0AAI8YZV3_9PEZI|nr:Hypothetical predicted protein [Lecanosticta acicola]